MGSGRGSPRSGSPVPTSPRSTPGSTGCRSGELSLVASGSSQTCRDARGPAGRRCGRGAHGHDPAGPVLGPGPCRSGDGRRASSAASADSGWRPRANPRVVRAGGEFEYRLRIIGPAARGSRDAADLTPLGASRSASGITRLPDEVSTDPPWRGLSLPGPGDPAGFGRPPAGDGRLVRPEDGPLPDQGLPRCPRASRRSTENSIPATVDEAPLPRLDGRSGTNRADRSGTEHGCPGSSWCWPRWCGSVSLVEAPTSGNAGGGDGCTYRMARRLDAAQGAAETARRVTDGLVAYSFSDGGPTLGVLTPMRRPRPSRA